MISHLKAALRGADVFRSADHLTVIREVKSELKSRTKARNDSDLKSILSKLSRSDARTILRCKETGQFISVLPSTVNGTELSKNEFRDALNIRYSRYPSDLPQLCDGCGRKFSVRHALQCKTGGLVIARHDEIKHELNDLASRALIPSAVRDEPLINTSRPAVQMPEPDQSNHSVHRNFHENQGDNRGDILIRGLWEGGTDCIIDVRVTDLDAKSSLSKDPAKVLENHEKEKKAKYLEPCLKQRRHFTPFVVSTDGLLGEEAKSVLKKLSIALSVKWNKSYSEVRGYVNARMSIAIVRATHRCLRGSRVPTSRMSTFRPQWEDNAGLGLFRH
jgi:hypothetical protein